MQVIQTNLLFAKSYILPNKTIAWTHNTQGEFVNKSEHVFRIKDAITELKQVQNLPTQIRASVF